MTCRPSHEEALRRSRVLEHLRAFDPHVVGTLPLGIAVPGSDIDIVCHAPDAVSLAKALWIHLRGEAGFVLYQWSGAVRPIVARFEAHGWPFEIFGSADPVHDQPGWRHFEVERRLLDLGGPAFRSAVMALRRNGTKTEPAFAAVLGLPGDPYAALFDLCGRPDEELVGLLDAKAFRRGPPSPEA